jgi:hypothetical protein
LPIWSFLGARAASTLLDGRLDSNGVALPINRGGMGKELGQLGSDVRS